MPLLELCYNKTEITADREIEESRDWNSWRLRYDDRLKRGTVKLIPHQEEWDQNAKEMIGILFELLNDAAIDIQHVGSTAIQSIHAKPIIDIAVGVGELNDILPYIELLKQHGIIYRGEDVKADAVCDGGFSK